MRISRTASVFRAYGALLGLLAGLGATAAGAAPRTTLWKLTLAADVRSDELLAGGLVQQNGDLVAQVNIAYGKPQSPSATETRFIRIHSGKVAWLSRTALTPGGLLAEAPGGGWYTVSVAPSPSSSNADLLIRRRSASGQLMWSVQWDDPLHHPDLPRAVAADPSGNLLIAGEADGAPAIWKYDPQGNLLWSAISAAGEGAFTHLALAADGAAYAAGYLARNAGDFLVARYLTAGTEAWTRAYPDLEGRAEQVTAISLFPGGDVCISGPSHTLADSGTFRTFRYRTDGTLLWTQPYSDPDLVDYTPTGAAVDSFSYAYVYATGWAGGKPSTILIKYQPGSEPEWFVTRPRVQGLALPGGDLRLDAKRYLHLAGRDSRGKGRFTLSTYSTKGQALRDVNLALGVDPTLVGLDPQRNVLLLANPWRGEARKHDLAALAVPAYNPPPLFP